ncbi:C-3',4' desaturase CrtD [filamentous cyanobacterium CCP5]|nr:C-3',4' desaturase CrtD [filamentous cyanobacterium CCP5]
MPPQLSRPARSQTVVVIGAGIGGLTAAALLARRGYRVRVFDQAIVPGGCASTFKRRGFVFDVGATQVAGLEPGGIHAQIFADLDVPLPKATPVDPACAVYLPGESAPINVWRDPDQWRQERRRQFPGSETFWQLMEKLFRYGWRFQCREPILPPRSLWDLGQLLQAVRPDTLLALPYAPMTVGQVLKLQRLYHDRRLRTFLDLQLKLYSQVNSDETALLYAATALGISRAPLGIYHLQGSMQVLSDTLEKSLSRDGGLLQMRHTVERIYLDKGQVAGVTVRSHKDDRSWQEPADHIVANVTVQNLTHLLANQVPDGYRQRVENLSEGNGAFVIYLGVKRGAIPDGCPCHLQFLYDYEGPIGENNSLFVSVSHPGDGRAPTGCATITASSFTQLAPWWLCDNYEAMKQDYTRGAIARLGQFFDLSSENIVYVEAATPRTFARYTARDKGAVGGLGMRVSNFGPFGFANRTPISGLWLVGDSTHPGEGTAGVSYSALTTVKQIDAIR